MAFIELSSLLEFTIQICDVALQCRPQVGRLLELVDACLHIAQDAVRLSDEFDGKGDIFG